MIIEFISKTISCGWKSNFKNIWCLIDLFNTIVSILLCLSEFVKCLCFFLFFFFFSAAFYFSTGRFFPLSLSACKCFICIYVSVCITFCPIDILVGIFISIFNSIHFIFGFFFCFSFVVVFAVIRRYSFDLIFYSLLQFY